MTCPRCEREKINADAALRDVNRLGAEVDELCKVLRAVERTLSNILAEAPAMPGEKAKGYPFDAGRAALKRIRDVLAAHPAPACPGGKHCPHYPECGTRADPRPAPREEDWGSNIEALIRKCQREGIPHTVYTRAPEPLAPGVSVEVPPARVHIPNLPAGWECGCRECMCDGDSHAWDPEKGCPEPPAPKCAWHWKGTQVGPGMHAPGCPAAKREGGGQ